MTSTGVAPVGFTRNVTGKVLLSAAESKHGKQRLSVLRNDKVLAGSSNILLSQIPARVRQELSISWSRAKLSVRAPDGKTIILKIAGDRHLLGLRGVVSGRPSPVSATTIEVCQIKFVEQHEFHSLLARDRQARMRCAQLLVSEVGTAFDDVTISCSPAVRRRSWPGCCCPGSPLNRATAISAWTATSPTRRWHR